MHLHAIARNHIRGMISAHEQGSPSVGEKHSKDLYSYRLDKSYGVSSDAMQATRWSSCPI
eukprot:m.996646 g.996646  ORF g.996646 m.996646 type:complete len:60 (-) comp24020_c1_seq4:64-243(-)